MKRMIILYTQRDYDLDRNYSPIQLSWSMGLESPSRVCAFRTCCKEQED